MNKKPKTESASQICLCEVMLEDELSEVDSEQCDCDDCLRAMAEAYNQFLKESIVTTDETVRHAKTVERLAHKNQTPTRRHYGDSDACHRCAKWDQNRCEESMRSLSESQLKQLMVRVNNRIQSNLLKHKLLQADQKKQKIELMKKVKEQLKKLSYRCKIELQKAGKKPVRLEKLRVWNYQPLGNKQNSEKCFEDRHRDKLKAPTYTGLVDLQALSKMSFINQVKRRVREEYQKKKQKIHKCDYDDCDRHHMNTPVEDIAKSVAKTEERAKKYLQKLQKLKKDKENLEKLKEAKLRGLALQAKHKLNRSKKHSLSTDRTTFNLEIQEFSTFSHLRQHYEEDKKQKQMEKQFGNPIKQIHIVESIENKQVDNRESEKQENFRRTSKEAGIKASTKEQRQQNLKSVQSSLRQDPVVIKAVASMQPARLDEDPDLLKSDKPIDQKNLRNIFREAKMVMAPAQVDQAPNKKTITKKPSIKETKFEKQRVEINKKQIQKNLDKNKRLLIQSYQNRKDRAYGEVLNPGLEKPEKRQSNQQIKEAFIKKLKEKQEPKGHHVEEFRSSNHFQQNYNYYGKVEDSNELARGKIAVSDPILDKRQYDQKQHDPSHILLDNDFLSEEDKKVFILNYRLLSKAEQLRI